MAIAQQWCNGGGEEANKMAGTLFAKSANHCTVFSLYRFIFPRVWSMREGIYNPITILGFFAMFTFQLDNTKR